MPLTYNTLRRTTAPVVEPVTIEEAQQFLRGPVSDDNAMILRHIAAASRWVENYTGRALVRQTWEMTLPNWCNAIELPKPPVASITSLKYYDTAGVLQTLDPSQYLLTADDWSAKVTPAYGVTWPSARCRPDAIQVTFVAGYAPSTGSPIDYRANVPEQIKHAILRMVQLYYDNLKPEDMDALRKAVMLDVDLDRVVRI